MSKDAKGSATVYTVYLEELAYRNFVLIDALLRLLCEKGLITHDEWRGRVEKPSTACIIPDDFIDELPAHLRDRADAAGERWRPLSLEEVCRLHIQRVLEMCEGNRRRAAQILGIGRTSLYRYLKREGKAKASTAA